MYAGREAVEYYTQILGLLTVFARSDATSDKILEILLKQAYVHLNLGDTGEASRDIEQAEQVLELTHSPKLSTTFYLRRAQLLYRTGDCLQAKSGSGCMLRDSEKNSKIPFLEMYCEQHPGNHCLAQWWSSMMRITSING